MRRVGADDAGAYRTLVERHLRSILAFAYRTLSDAGEAEDVAQEAFLRLWRQAGTWRPDARVSTWLHRVAYNLCVDRMRRRRDVPMNPMPDLPDPADGPMAEHQRRQVSATVDAALAGLPERQRTAIALVHHQELSNIEAAEVMDISVEALESLLARGRRALRQSLLEDRDALMGDI
jgi:RNA polymerase sigma-70 factor (ECF subfamily)